jgi:cytidine diphosphoramidate kinase
MQDSKGNVIWITGFSGAGKTTVARILQGKLRKAGKVSFLVDGDEMRQVLGCQESYSPESRIELSFIYSRLCQKLSDDGIDVICSTMSLFEEVRRWNRENILNYTEVYLRVPYEVLADRGAKGLYEKYEGLDDPEKAISKEFESPLTPDLIIENYPPLTSEIAAIKIIERVFPKP